MNFINLEFSINFARYLNENQLTGTIPKQLFYLTKLTELYVKHFLTKTYKMY